MGPGDAPAVRVSEIVAAGSWQVGVPLDVSVNFTGTTPRLSLKTLDPSELIGGCTLATSAMHWVFEVNGAAATLRVGAPTLKLGESTLYHVAAEGKVVPMFGLTDDQLAQPAILPLASVLISRTSLPPAPKLVVDPATT